MSPEPSGPAGTYELRVPKTHFGVFDPRTSILLWGLGSIFVGLILTLLLVQGQIREMLLVLLGILGLLCLAPLRGIFILTAFLPFMYFLRRLILNYQAFEQRDPVLLFPVMTSVLVFLGVLIFHRGLVLRCFKESALLKAVGFLMLWFFMEVFNSRQGSLLVGAAGAMFFIVPLTWCFIGLLVTREMMDRLLKMVLVIGCLTALYGLWQHYFGLTWAEVYELRSKQFLKSFGGVQKVRIMSTFAGIGDFSRYLTISGFVAFAYWWRDRRRVAILVFMLLTVYTLLWTAVRTSFLVLVFSLLMFLVLSGPSIRQVLVRGTVALLLVMTLYGVLYSYDPRSMYNQQFSENPFVVHTISGITHPTQENTFKIRIQNWIFVVRSAITEYWVGRGLGSTTTAARKFEGGKPFEADSYFFELFYGSGLIAPALFAFIVYVLMRDLILMTLGGSGTFLYRVCFGVLCGAVLGSVFGLAARDTITGPLVWLIIGFVVREKVEQDALEPRLTVAGAPAHAV